MSLVERGLAARLGEAVARFPVVVLEGGRAVGKSTLCRVAAEEGHWAPPLDLTLPERLAQLRLDPLRTLRDRPTPVVIDEAQLEPQLPLWIKAIVDERGGRPGQFLLTGSARLGREQLGGSDPLAGRAIRLRLWPLTDAELAERATPFAARLFTPGAFEPGTTVVPERSRRWMSGGLPAIPGVRSPAPPHEWMAAMSSYVESTIPLGARTSRIDHGRLVRVFRYLAANPGHLLNLASASSDLAMKSDTLRSYIDQLEASFLLFRVEAQRPAEHRVLTAHPRVFPTDVGLAGWALGLAGREPSPQEFGSLVETHVAVGLAAGRDWSPERIALRHWRDDRSKREIDLLLVHPDGRLAAIEVKASTSVGPADTAGLVTFAGAHHDRFTAGYVAYAGDEIVDLSPPDLPARTILALPQSVLLGAAG